MENFHVYLSVLGCFPLQPSIYLFCFPPLSGVGDSFEKYSVGECLSVVLNRNPLCSELINPFLDIRDLLVRYAPFDGIFIEM